jgi:hypothetical protein
MAVSLHELPLRLSEAGDHADAQATILSQIEAREASR